MGQSTLKRARRAERGRLLEVIVQAHDRIHKGQVDEAEEILHQALGAGDYDGDVASLSQHHGFDEAFRRLCVARRLRAAYVLVGEMNVEEREVRLISGGDSILCALLDASIANYQREES